MADQAQLDLREAVSTLGFTKLKLHVSSILTAFDAIRLELGCGGHQLIFLSSIFRSVRIVP